VIETEMRRVMGMEPGVVILPLCLTVFCWDVALL
jgi:hypothetical protein